MTKYIFQVDPFPEPTHAGQEIENIGLLFGTLSFLFFLIILMIYMYKVIKDIIPIVIIYGFSLIIGVYSFECILPFTPYCSLFFIVFQTGLFIMSSMELYTSNKNRGK